MATEKKITSRIQQKHDVAANWAKATNFIPKKGEIIIYDAEYNASGEETQAVRFKIGDGSKTVNNLPFAVIDRTVKLGGGSAPSGTTTPYSETIVNKLYVNKFLNSKSFRAICEWLDSDQIFVIITTEYSAVYLHHCVGMFKSEITTSSSNITPVDTSNLGTYHFIIATEMYYDSTEVTRKVLYSEKSGDAHFSYRDPVTGSTVTWEETVDAGWSGVVNENYEYDAGEHYYSIVQPIYYGLDQGKTPVGNYFFAGSPFTVEYASSILSSVVTESVLGGDRERGYYCNKTWRTNRLSGWRCYQTGNLIGDFPFNTDLNATACGTCFYNITGEASDSSEGSLQGTSLKRVVLQANGAIIIKIVPIVSNRADGNGDWTLCACSLYAGSTYANYGLWVIPNPLTIRDPLGDNSETVFWNNSWTFDTTKGFVPELNGPVDGKQVKYINFEALSLLNKYFIFTQQYETIRLSINEIANIQGKYALAMASSVGEISTSLINVEQSVSGKQDKITSTNKLSSDLVSGLGAAAAKAVDTAISANSTSTNLPTSKAVEDRINAHSGIDKVGTITGIKMNSTSKGTSGVVDLGTVLTDASKFATSAQGTKADNAVPNTRKVNNKALSSDITLGAADVGVTETAFPGLKKTGTVTGVKMNGTTKNPSSGVVDLGTVLTSHQDISGKLDKTTYEWNKEFAAGSNGAISLGRYNVYDTQLTFDISSTTSASMNGKLVIATQNGRICQAKVFGDANGVLVSKIVIYQSAIVNNRSWIEIFCNFDGWSKNKVHIYGVALNSATVTNQMSSVTFTNGIPSPITSGDYGWSGTIDNDLSNWTGSSGTIRIGYGSMTFSAKSGDTYGTAGFDMNNAGDNSCGGWSVDENTAHLRLGIDGACDIELGEDAGTAGQVLTSQGSNTTPQWKSMPTYSLSGTTLTITLP